MDVRKDQWSLKGGIKLELVKAPARGILIEEYEDTTFKELTNSKRKCTVLVDQNLWHFNHAKNTRALKIRHTKQERPMSEIIIRATVSNP